jgi:hypothetical protein
MRALPLLVLAVVLVAAGCVKKADDGGTPTTTPTGGSTTPTGGSTSPTTPTDNGTPTMPMTTPKDIKSGSVTFTPDQCQPTMPCTGFPVKFTVDAGYTHLTLNVTWACAGGVPACLTNDATVAVGSNACSLPAGPVQPPVAACKKDFAAADGQVTATGTGAVTATYKLTES